MLNPERVDIIYNRGFIDTLVEIEFTTEEAHPALTIILTESDAMNLAHLIMNQCSYAAKKKRH